jgi:hypothetical protein
MSRQDRMNMVYEVNPLLDPRWDNFLRMHPLASVFHTSRWLNALHQTYGFEPVVYTTSAPSGEITNGVPFCKVRGAFGECHLTSIPFSDHSPLLVDDLDDLMLILRTAEQKRNGCRARYLEIRPTSCDRRFLEERTSFRLFNSFLFHSLDLTADIQNIYSGFHKMIKRALNKAVREQIQCTRGSSEQLQAEFFDLLVMTRRKHGLPPPPRLWFQNVMRSFKDGAEIRVAYKDKVPIASILTLLYKQTLYYKYSCSNDKYRNLGGTQTLIWDCVRKGKESGAIAFDMGRSDCEQQGLVLFKQRWGCRESQLHYYRSPSAAEARPAFVSNALKVILSRMPSFILVLLGKTIYKYYG